MTSLINILKTAVVFTITTLFAVFANFVSNRFGGHRGKLWVLSIAVAANILLYFFSDRIILIRYWATRAKPPRLQHESEIVERLAAKFGITPPRLYQITSQSPNVFSVGRSPNHASIVMTDGLLRLLTDEELEAILAHELSHICNYDVLPRSIAPTFVSTVLFLLRLPFQICAIYPRTQKERRDTERNLTLLYMPVAAILIRLLVSPGSEYAADDCGASYTGKPEVLARTLQKLEADFKRIPMEASPSTAHLFAVQPLILGKRQTFLCSHPPVSHRIERLTTRQLAAMGG